VELPLSPATPPRVFHPWAGIFPLSTEAEVAILAEDIRAHGLHVPIVVDPCGTIIDGRNRYRALQLLRVDHCPEYYVSTHLEGAALLGYIVGLNLHRRHLDESQRAMVAAKLATLRHGQRADYATDAQIYASAENAGPAITQPDAAALLNVSRRAVQHAVKVRDEGIPALQHAVEEGTIAVSTAADVATLPAEEQEELVARASRKFWPWPSRSARSTPTGRTIPGRMNGIHRLRN
jgi:hypothetical protein